MMNESSQQIINLETVANGFILREKKETG